VHSFSAQSLSSSSTLGPALHKLLYAFREKCFQPGASQVYFYYKYLVIDTVWNKWTTRLGAEEFYIIKKILIGNSI
jgi:hypothetical protein